MCRWCMYDVIFCVEKKIGLFNLWINFLHDLHFKIFFFLFFVNNNGAGGKSKI